MTRITDLGRKRTYLEAGFEKADADETPVGERNDEPVPATEKAPRKKPRKRRRKSKAPEPSQDEAKGPEDVQAGPKTYQVNPEKAEPTRHEQSTKKMRKEAMQRTAEEKAAASERRRQSRILERHAHTTCLACRKQGHTVKDCPNARTALHEDDAGNTGAPGRSAVGICYRCGSTRHNLSRCKKPVNPARPLPFASCFVCSGKGHLASSCPKNQGRGIYPNGGSCKLCGQTSHLAKDCELRTQEQASRSAVLLGDGPNEGGADEDDFHVLKRRRDAVQQDEKIHQKVTRHPDLVVAKPKPKVVVFS